MKTTLETPAAAKLLFDTDPHSGDPATLERYYSTDGQTEIACTTGEREDWQSESGLDLDTNMPDAATLESLRAWLAANAGLRATA